MIIKIPIFWFRLNPGYFVVEKAEDKKGEGKGGMGRNNEKYEAKKRKLFPSHL